MFRIEWILLFIIQTFYNAHYSMSTGLFKSDRNATQSTLEKVLPLVKPRMHSRISLGLKASNSKENLHLDKTIELIPKENVRGDIRTLRNQAHKFQNIKEKDIVIYNKKSGILTDPFRKDELLNVSEKEKRKAFRIKFKRDLQTERIHFQLPMKGKEEIGQSVFILKENTHTRKTYPQNIIFKMLGIENIRSPGFPSHNQKNLMSILHNFPVFTVENNLRQLILSYPAEAFIKNWADKLYDYYYRVFEWEKDTRATNIGFFFFNPEDAKLYESNIRSFGPFAAKDLGTRVIPYRLSKAYQLHRTSPPETRFLFIPDIKELGDLLNVYRHRYGNKMKFNPKQEITRSGFANQPLYTIEDVNLRKNFFWKQSISYQGELPQYQYIFLTVDGAEAAWSNFRKQNLDLKLPSKPNLSVYNFNSFIRDRESDSDLNQQKYMFIFNRETYELIDSLASVHSSKSSIHRFYENQISSKLFFIKLWFNRFRLVLFHAPRINEYPRRDLLLNQPLER